MPTVALSKFPETIFSAITGPAAGPAYGVPGGDDAGKMMSIQILSGGAPTFSLTIEGSLNGGTTWQQLAAPITALGITNLTVNTPIVRFNVTSLTVANLTVIAKV